jgi:hypothetical protein
VDEFIGDVLLKVRQTFLIVNMFPDKDVGFLTVSAFLCVKLIVEESAKPG